MSMHEYATEYYGVLIRLDDLAGYAKANQIDPDDLDDHMITYAEVTAFSDASGECSIIREDGNLHFPEAAIEFEGCYIGQAKYWPNLFKAAYSSYADLLAELQDRYGKYLPADFPWPDRIVQFLGTYYC
jgi:hypothetical protein